MAEGHNLSVDDVDLGATSRQVVESHRRTRVGDGCSELGYVAQRIIERKHDPLCQPELVGLGRAPQRGPPGVRVCHQLADRDVEYGTRCAKGYVAEELLPNHHAHVGEGADVEPRVEPESFDLLDPISHSAVQLAYADQPHPFVMDVAGLRYRGAK